MTNGVFVVLYVSLAFALCWVGKRAYGLFHPKARVDLELTAKDNLAFAVPLGAYYLGILIVMGAPLAGQTRGSLVEEAVAFVLWGVLAIVLLNVSSLIKHRLVFQGVDLLREAVETGNGSAGIVLAGSHIASALLVLGALGEEGGLLPAAGFWLYAQCLLTLAAWTFLRLIHAEFAAQIRRDNRALALSLAGVLVAMGNVLRLAISGPFEGWTRGFVSATGYAMAGFVLLFAARWLTDWLLLPGVTIRREVAEQPTPNIGVGYIEAVFYLGTSFLIAWTL